MNKIFGEIRNQLDPSQNALDELYKQIEKENICNAVEQKKGDKKRIAIPAICTAAVACIAVGVGVGISGNLQSEEIERTHTNQMNSLATEIGVVEEVMEDAAIIKRWDEMTDPERYVSLTDEYYGLTISGRTASENIGESVGNVVLEGYDHYTDTLKTIEKEAFSVNSINPDCALAVELDGEYYIYVNHYYEFEDLGDMVNSLGLRENLSFGTIEYSYFDDNMSYHYVTYSPLESDIIWDMLLSDPDVKNEGDAHYGADLMGISISSDVLGFKNISLAVNEDGYLQTNILATAKSFYIGKDKVQAFVDYVKKNCEIKSENVIVNEPDDFDTVDDDTEVTGAEAPSYDPGEIVTMTSWAYNPQTSEE